MNRLFTPEMLKAATQSVNSPARRLIRAVDKETGSSIVMVQHKNGAFTVIAEHIIPSHGGPVECECDPEHTVAKLGHCFDCPAFRPGQVTAIQHDLLRGSIGCPPRHFDGTPHDFDWATY